ncbi:early activation antigen CD69-like [Malurus melanocephalus]|uniref:early activation antigen CD69-like n=1 Tax=Malurus melanocephalus TaxID=175006 RepID=UPI002547C130|nr:early activation antigen CD69-like [Malurus melanocephalus]
MSQAGQESEEPLWSPFVVLEGHLKESLVVALSECPDVTQPLRERLPAVSFPLMPRQEPVPEQRWLVPVAVGATCESAVGEDVENRFCARNGSVKESLGPQNRSATRNKQKQTLKGFLAPVKWIRSHPVLTLVVLILLLLLVLSLGVSLAVVSVRSYGEIPVTPVTPHIPLLLACPHDWVGHRGICYFLSRDQLSWDQAQARCSELGASLAVLQDWEMEFLFPHSARVDYWLGLRRRGRELQWGDGSSFNSSVEVRGNAGCVYLAENYLGCGICSNPIPYVCSRPQTHL